MTMDDCPVELRPDNWVFDEGYRYDGYRVPVVGEEVWSPTARTVVRANGQELYARAVLVFTGKVCDNPTPAPPSLSPDFPETCLSCGAPVRRPTEGEKMSQTRTTVLPFPKTRWIPS